MSSKNRKSAARAGAAAVPERDESYPTPRPLCDAIVTELERRGFLRPAMTVLEPSAGSGNFVAALCRDPSRYVVDAIDPSSANVRRCRALGAVSVFHTTLERYAAPNGPGAGRIVDAAVGNPPFSLAEKHIDLLLERVVRPRGVVALLLRLGHQLEADKRARRQWVEHKPALVLSLAPRPGFVGRADSTPYGVFVWQEGYVGACELDVLFWGGRNGKRGPAPVRGLGAEAWPHQSEP